MGRVYRAVLPSINAQVAIKVLSVEVASEPDIAERFIAEAKIANLVRHDGLVSVIGIGVVPDGRPYQVMELLHGATLAELIRARGRLPLGTTCVALCEALRALAALHAGGVIHRDVKSSNLFVTTGGHVKVIDFGIAKLVAGRGITQTGQTLGTPEYMAPEQLEGTAIDERVDLYSMGVVLFEAATGERPFKGRVLEALAARATPPGSGGPTGLDDVIAMAMAPDPERRFADALTMERALHEFAQTLPDDAFGPLADGPPLPRPTSLPTRDDLPRREAETQPSAQQMLGRYEVHGVIGKGAAGTVMAGFDPLIQRKVALKVLHPNKSHRDRLIREAQAMAKVSDPNIVTLYELGDDGSRLFLAMELVDGTDLATWLQQRRPWQEVVRVFVAAGRGLVAAHAGGIVHRDFKPANVLIGRDGRPRVGDFGLALGQGGGTPAYMAPEQVDGLADERSDQFAFCASLWEAVHGELPFAGESAVSLAISARAGAIRVPMQETPIDDILRRGLAAKSRDRYDTMAEVLALLDRAVAPRPRRWPWLAAAVALTAATATIAIAWTRHVTPVDLAQLRDAKIAHDPGSALRALGRVADDVLDTPEARQLAADAAAAGPTREIVAPSTITGIEVAPDGRRIVIASRNQIAIHDLVGGAAPVVLNVVGSPTQLVFEGSAMLASIDDAIVKVPLDGSAPQTLARCGHDDPFVMTGSQMITSTDLHFLSCSEMGGSVVTDTRTGHVIHTSGFVFDFGHDVERLLVVNNDVLSVLDAKTGAIIGTHPSGGGLIATHGDLVVLTEGKKVTAWNPIEPSDHEFTVTREIKFVLVARGPSQQIAVAGADGKAELYGVTGDHRGHVDLGGPLLVSDVPRDVTRNRFLFLTPGTLSIDDFDVDRHLTLATHAKGFAISADGSIVLLAQGTTATVWFPDLRAPTHVTMPVDALIAHSVNRDGSLLAYGDVDRVRVVDLATGKREESPVPTSASYVGFAADGTLGFADSMHRLWSWRIGGDRASLFGVYADPVRWMSLVDETHAAIMDHEQHVHAVGEGRPGDPCATGKALAVYGAFAIMNTGAATVACDLRSGATRPLTSTVVKRVAMASDGDRALVVDNGRPRLFRLVDGVEEPLPAIADIVEVAVDAIGRRGLVIDKSGDCFVVERGAAHAIPLADCHLPTAPQISADGARVGAVVDGHVRLWFVDRPDEPHDLGQLGPLAPAGISVVVGHDAVLTTSAGLQTDAGVSFVLNVWPAALPSVEQVRAWIRAVGG